MRLKLISVLAISAFAISAAADEGFKISGDLATSVFMESGSGRNSEFASAGAISPSAGEANGDFSLDLAEINLEKTVGNSGVFLGIGYGRMFDLINYTVADGGSAPKSTLNLTNAYFHHKVGDTGLSLKLGKFGSGVGYESYNYMNNINYTRAYSFNSMNPWFFTGLAADYTINEMFSVGAVVANAADNRDVDDNESKHMGVNATIKPMEALSIKLNYLTGRDGRTEGLAGDFTDTARINATVSYMVNSMFDVAFHYSNLATEDAGAVSVREDAEATSMALYAGMKQEMWGAGLRYEMVSDDDGLLFEQPDNEVAVITATAWYNVDQNAVLKFEVASTSADKQMFADDTGATDDAMMTYGLGFLYRF